MRIFHRLLLGAGALLVASWLLWVNVLDRAATISTSATGPVRFAPPVAGLRVHAFQTGRMVLPAWTVAASADGTRVMDQPAFLIEHPVHGLVMFEAGHHSDIAEDPGEHLGFIHAAGLMPMEQERGQDARSQLRASGFDPGRVRYIVVSHFHPEHVGAVEEFPNATIVADEREIAWGAEHPNYNYVPHEYDGVRRWRPLRFDRSAHFGPFRGAVDLLGDGSLLVVSTPGHTPGHVSLAVNLESGPVLLTGDVAWTELNLETGTIGLPFVSSDGSAARASLGELLRFREQNPEVLVVPGHDLAPVRRARRADLLLHPWPAAAPTDRALAARGGAGASRRAHGGPLH